MSDRTAKLVTIGWREDADDSYNSYGRRLNNFMYNNRVNKQEFPKNCHQASLRLETEKLDHEKLQKLAFRREGKSQWNQK